MVAILAAARLMAMMFRRIGQPAVVGEMAAGILLGPSFLGKVSPAIMNGLFPESPRFCIVGGVCESLRRSNGSPRFGPCRRANAGCALQSLKPYSPVPSTAPARTNFWP